jgi:peroxiredoxin
MTGMTRFVAAAAIAATCWTPAFAADAPKVGAPAPDFTASDIDGHQRRLSEFRGKTVVLEWHNQGCPFVKKHYGTGNMQRLQRELTGQGAVWLTIISSAPGKQGFVTAAQEKDYLETQQAAPTTVLLDPDGAVGHLYGAKTTPHMFVIDPQGVLAYAGAIDDRSTPDPDDVKGAKNYVEAAFADVKAGRPVAVGSTAPYGCSVKYSD